MIVSGHNELWISPVALLTFVCRRIFNILLTWLILWSLTAGKLSLAAQLINTAFACLEMPFLRQDLSLPLDPNAHFGLSAKQEKEKLEMIHLALFLVFETVYYLHLMLYCIFCYAHNLEIIKEFLTN
jgi:uncharacterized protein (DUF486 family)